jgi:DNA-binding transcriptional LysR family regulator
MDERLLHYFTLVVHHGSFSRAAAYANATQSTLSKAVAQLEESCGTPLLLRSRSGVRLTDAGQIVLDRARSIRSEFEHMRAELDALNGLERGELRLGIPPIGSDVLFAPPLASYRRRFPGIRILLMEQGSLQLQDLLIRREIDVAATMLPLLPGLSSRMLIEEPLLAVLSDDHRLTKQDRLDLTCLDSQPLLLFERGFALNELILRVCRRRGIIPVRTVSSAHVDFIVALASAGGGIAMLPGIALQGRSLRGVKTLPVDDPELRWSTVLAWRTEGVLPRAAQKWLDIVGHENDRVLTAAEEAAQH